MKRFLVFLTILAVAVLSFDPSAKAQTCTPCSLTISTVWASPIAATSGMIICVTPTGSITGDILINGGTVCNEGYIGSAHLLILNGDLQNNGILDVDSLSQDGPSSRVFNLDSFTVSANSIYNGSQFYNYGHYTSTNTSVFYGGQFISPQGQMSCTNFSVFDEDTAQAPATLYLELPTTFSCDSLFVHNAHFMNDGEATVHYDFRASGVAEVTNNEYLWIGRDFSNDSLSQFYTHCMVHIGRNWSNAGIMNGPTTGCGGFSVVGLTGNYGIFGQTGHLDMCDASNPGSFDINLGTLGTGVTFCTCTDSCVYYEGISEQQVLHSLNATVYPNPFDETLSLDVFSSQAGRMTLSVFDVVGQ